MHTVQKVIIISNTCKDEAAALALEISALLKRENLEPFIYDYEGKSGENPFSGYDLAITLGGDGTVLFAARYCGRLGIPIFPVNLGEFGFIAGVEKDSWQSPLLDYLAHRLESAPRMMLNASVVRSGTQLYSSDVLNDVVVSGKGMAKIVNLHIQFDGISFGSYRADGIIAATPTGSTAYSAASGGPILDPDLSAFVLTPVSAFSLSNRPIVLPSTGVMEIKMLPMRHKDAVLMIDGQELFPLAEGDTVIVKESVHKAYLVGCGSPVFYNALRSKLNWSGAPVPDSGGSRA